MPSAVMRLKVNVSISLSALCSIAENCSSEISHSGQILQNSVEVRYISLTPYSLYSAVSTSA